MAGDNDQIRTATREDVTDVARILGQGFSDDPVMAWVLADVSTAEERGEVLEAMFAFISREATIDFGATHLLGDGCAMWTPPDPPEWPADRVSAFLTSMAAVASADALGRLGAMEEVMGEHHPKEPHWYLGAVACLPESRGAGVGGRLLDHALSDIDAAGLPAYLESSNRRNLSLYERKGFEVTGVVHLPDEGPPLTLMWRPAR